MDYYNEWDPYCAQWLRNLIKAKLLPEGEVDERDIRDVQSSDLRGYRSCHFFAGLGGWPLALKMSGYAGPVWTGSCPCQPFSNAGQRKGHGEERHLWPVLSALIRERKPAIFFGEQVASAIGMGWLDAVAADLEAQAYAFGAAVLPACAVSAPHERQRVWFVADRDWKGKFALSTASELVPDAGGKQHQGSCAENQRQAAQELSVADADTCDVQGLFSRNNDEEKREVEREGQTGLCSRTGHWSVEPSVGRVAHGIPARVAKLRALGNAIVPQVAAEFIKAVVNV